MEKIYVVNSISCMHCVNRITKALMALEVVKNVEIDLKTKQVKVVFNGEIADQIVVDAINKAGYRL